MTTAHFTTPSLPSDGSPNTTCWDNFLFPAIQIPSPPFLWLNRATDLILNPIEQAIDVLGRGQP